MKLVHSVPMSAKKFTQEDLDISMKYVNTSVYPGLYDKKELHEGIEFDKRKIVPINTINFDISEAFIDLDLKDLLKNNFLSQPTAIRLNGRGENADEVISYIHKVGFELSHWPISIALCPDGKIYILDGRTRLEALNLCKFTNVIVDFYVCTSWRAFFAEAIKRNPPQQPRSPMKKEDIISHCGVFIEKGWLKRDYNEINTHIKQIAGDNIKNNTLQKIIHNVMNGSGYTSGVLSLSEAKAAKWLQTNGYFDNENNNGIYYIAVSASAWTKAVKQSADKLVDELEGNGKRVKELRVVLHTGTLDGADPEKSWQGKIDSFRTGWKSDIDNIEKAFFKGASRRAVIKLYGAIPAVSSLSGKWPMDKLVMFHVGTLKDSLFSEINFEEELEDALLS